MIDICNEPPIKNGQHNVCSAPAVPCAKHTLCTPFHHVIAIVVPFQPFLHHVIAIVAFFQRFFDKIFFKIFCLQFLVQYNNIVEPLQMPSSPTGGPNFGDALMRHCPPRYKKQAEKITIY